ncbi:hypothetical protein ACEPAI_8329 [Sanghuangporus weigelae]
MLSFLHKDSHREARDDYEEYREAKARGEHKGHPKTAGVAAFLAMEALSHHEKTEGKKPIGMTKKILVSLVAAEVDKLVEEKAIPAAEAHHYKKEAERKAHTIADERYSEAEEAY